MGRAHDPLVLDVRRIAQPDEQTCGPTCLAQVYRYYGLDKPLDDVLAETTMNPGGGTLGVHLAIAALRNGFRATIHPYSLRVFDPTWRRLPPEELVAKLRKRAKAVESKRLKATIQAHVEYLEQGGRVRFGELDRTLLQSHLQRGTPILTGLSATYLYRTPREHRDEYDDVRGHGVGHFVVISGYYPSSDRFLIRDPSTHVPFSRSGRYTVPSDRLIAAILLGDLTYDAELVVIEPARRRRSA